LRAQRVIIKRNIVAARQHAGMRSRLRDLERDLVSAKALLREAVDDIVALHDIATLCGFVDMASYLKNSRALRHFLQQQPPR
jgi:hypothetical protein